MLLILNIYSDHLDHLTHILTVLPNCVSKTYTGRQFGLYPEMFNLFSGLHALRRAFLMILANGARVGLARSACKAERNEIAQEKGSHFV